jgi:hypothetical protein
MRLPNRLLALAIALAVGLAAAPAVSAAEETIFTTAGTGVAGFSGDGGPATLGNLNHPRGLAALPDGGFLIADAGAHRVRRVLPNGNVTTVAGTGVAGFSGDGGPATAARLNQPHAVAALPDGGFLIADANNFRVRKVSSAGTISTVAGTGVKGYAGDGGPATAARISAPRGLDAFGDGSFLIADTDNRRIRRVSVGGIITTVAGVGISGFSGDGGPATSAKISSIYGVSALPQGGFLIADSGTARVRRVSAEGTITTVAGTGVSGFSGDGGPAIGARIAAPYNTAPLPDGGFLIADTANQRVRRVSASGTITTVAGSGSAGFAGEGGSPTNARLSSPKAMLAFAGGFLIADSENHRVRFVGSGPWPSPAPGSGTVYIDGASAYATSPGVEVSVPASGVAEVRLSNSSATSGGLLTSGRTYGYATPIAWDLSDPATGGSGANGVRYVYVQWRDGAGNWSPVARDSIVLDTVAPTVSAPSESLVTGAQLGTSTIPVKLSWSGSDATSGVAGYDLAQSKDGGPFTTTLASTTAKTWTGSLSPGATYAFRARATDTAGNVGGWSTGPTFPLELRQESSPTIAYDPSWNSELRSGSSGGSVRYTSTAGATATVSFTGRRIAWVAPKDSTRGSADVYVDGVRAATVSLYATAAKSRLIVFNKSWTAPGPHTLEIRNLATAGHPRVDVDAFVIFG